MYDRFTDRARKVFQLANQEAQRFDHEYIGTEHILLGLLKEERTGHHMESTGTAIKVLNNLDVDLRKIRLEVEKLMRPGLDMVTMGKLPQTPRAKKVIEYSMEEARNLNHNYVGTEHILLGLLREQEGIAGTVLMNLGLTLKAVREEVLNLLGHGGEVRPDVEQPPKKHRRLLRLAKLIGGCEHWAVAWAPGEYERHIVEGIERLRELNLCDPYGEIKRLQADLAGFEAGAQVEADAGDEARTEVADLLWLLRYEWRQQNPKVPAPDFLTAARVTREAAEAAERKGK